MQIHFLQFDYLRVTAENVYYALPAERWAYFLQDANQLTPAEIHRLFPDEETVEAAGVMEMISQTSGQSVEFFVRMLPIR